MAKKTDPTKFRGVSRLDEKRLRAHGEHAKKRMWAAPLLSRKRAEFEKLANSFFKAADQAHLANTSPLLKGSPAKKWSTPNARRRVDWIGVLNTGTGIATDALLAIAGGAQAGGPLREKEQRATILGALMALKQAGDPALERLDLKSLSAPIVGSREINARLSAAIGAKGQTLEQATHHAIRRVSSFGPHMEALAWADRGLVILSDVAGFESVHALAAGVVSVFVPIGTIVGAAIGAHSAISMAICDVLKRKMVDTAKKNLRGAKAAMKKRHPDAGAGVDDTALGGFSVGWLLAALGGAALAARAYMRED